MEFPFSERAEVSCSWLLRPRPSRLAGLCPGWAGPASQALLEWYASLPPALQTCLVFGPQEYPLLLFLGKRKLTAAELSDMHSFHPDHSYLSCLWASMNVCLLSHLNVLNTSYCAFSIQEFTKYLTVLFTRKA